MGHPLLQSAGPCVSHERVRRRPGKGNGFSDQGCQIDSSTLKPSSLASVKVNHWKIAVGRGVKVPFPDIFTHMSRSPIWVGHGNKVLAHGSPMGRPWVNHIYDLILVLWSAEIQAHGSSMSSCQQSMGHPYFWVSHVHVDLLSIL